MLQGPYPELGLGLILKQLAQIKTYRVILRIKREEILEKSLLLSKFCAYALFTLLFRTQMSASACYVKLPCRRGKNLNNLTLRYL